MNYLNFTLTICLIPKSLWLVLNQLMLINWC
jgi:hypothetical protein